MRCCWRTETRTFGIKRVVKGLINPEKIRELRTYVICGVYLFHIPKLNTSVNVVSLDTKASLKGVASAPKLACIDIGAT